MADITILGSGGFGLALAIMCDNAGHKVTVWSKFQDEIDAIKRTGELKAKLPGVQVNKTIELTTDISCVKNKDMVILGIPSPFLREVCESVVPCALHFLSILGKRRGTLHRIHRFGNRRAAFAM